jgi:hypothetical protein
MAQPDDFKLITQIVAAGDHKRQASLIATNINAWSSWAG